MESETWTHRITTWRAAPGAVRARAACDHEEGPEGQGQSRALSSNSLSNGSPADITWPTDFKRWPLPSRTQGRARSRANTPAFLAVPVASAIPMIRTIGRSREVSAMSWPACTRRRYSKSQPFRTLTGTSIPHKAVTLRVWPGARRRTTISERTSRRLRWHQTAHRLTIARHPLIGSGDIFPVVLRSPATWSVSERVKVQNGNPGCSAPPPKPTVNRGPRNPGESVPTRKPRALAPKRASKTRTTS